MARARVGVIGDPVEHSISPAMQQPALDVLGIDATYERWQTPLDGLPARIESLRLPDALGANVTVPHKLAVMPLVDEVSPLARRAGAVNTIVNRDGQVFGDNTDVHGFAASLSGAFGELGPIRAVALGAGGASRAVILALESAGAGEIVLWSRDRAKSERLTAELAPAPIRPIDADQTALRRELSGASVLVNATPLGWRAGEHPIPLESLAYLPARAIVVDLTYRDTDLLLAARARGLRTLDGLGMLVHQGAKALELWTGKPAPVELMMAAAIAARTARA